VWVRGGVVVFYVVISGGFQITAENFHVTTMFTMNDYVTYNTEYKVLICRQHKYGISPDGILRHFRNFHKAVPLATRKAINDYSKTLDLAAPTTPHEPIQPVEGLTIVKGFKCSYDGCSELRGTEMSIKQHCWETHEWKAGASDIWVNQECQTFFEGSRHKYVGSVAF
jgi:hypothetical protein